MFLNILQNPQENTTARVSFSTSCLVFFNKLSYSQVFYCEFCEIITNAFFINTSAVLDIHINSIVFFVITQEIVLSCFVSCTRKKSWCCLILFCFGLFFRSRYFCYCWNTSKSLEKLISVIWLQLVDTNKKT